MDNTDNHSNPDAERVQGSPDNGQPPSPRLSSMEARVSGIVDGMVDLHEAVVRLGVEVTALSNQLGEDGSDFLEISRINQDLTNEIGVEELESTTNHIRAFRRDIHDQVAQLSETARFWLEQDAEETAFMPPEVPPGSPETTSAELGGPSFVPPSHPLINPPRLLLGRSYHTPPLPELAHPNLSDLLHAHTLHEYNGMPQLLSASDSSDDDEVDLSEYRTRFQAAGQPTRNPNNGPSSDDYGMPGLMSVSDSSDDEGIPTDGSTPSENDPHSNDDSGRDEEEAQEESAPPALNPPYTRDPWVVPGSWMHQLLMQGQAPDDSSPPSLIGSEVGQPPESLETREPHTRDAAWQSSRMQKLLSSLEVLNESTLDRFCRVGGGGGEHNDQCMICWESLKVEPVGDRSWTAIENALSEETGQTSTSAGNLSATSATSASLILPLGLSGAAALPCLHVFHFKCLVPWFDKLVTTCPVCRFDLDPRKLLWFSGSVLPNLQRQAGLPLQTRNSILVHPLVRQAVTARVSYRIWTGHSPTSRVVQSSTTSPIQGMDGGDSSWSSTEDSIPSLHSIPAQQDDQNIAEDTASEHSNGDSMPSLAEPPANGAGDPAEGSLWTAQSLQAITSLGPASNGASNPSGISHGTSDEERPTAPSTGADNTRAPENTISEELDPDDSGRSTSDTSTDVDSMPSLIAPEELDHLSTSPNMGGNPRVAREDSRGTPDEQPRDLEVADQNEERYRDRSANAPVTSMTDSPQEAAFRNFAVETRTFLSEIQDTLLNAYVRLSNIHPETAADVAVLRAQANRRTSLTGNRDVANMSPPQSAPSVNSASLPYFGSNRPPLWMSSQDTARREWVLPKGPVEGGVVNWINKREVEIRGDLESLPH